MLSNCHQVSLDISSRTPNSSPAFIPCCNYPLKGLHLHPEKTAGEALLASEQHREKMVVHKRLICAQHPPFQQ